MHPEVNPPQQRPMSELRRIVADDQARFAELGELWNELVKDEQDELLAYARHMASEPK